MSKSENNLIALNKGKTVTLKHTNDQRMVISPVYGTYGFSCALYHKDKRSAFYHTGHGHACTALDYAAKLGYK